MQKQEAKAETSIAIQGGVTVAERRPNIGGTGSRGRLTTGTFGEKEGPAY